MKDYFFKPSVRSFFTSLIVSLICGVVGMVGFASSNPEEITQLMMNNTNFGQVPEEDSKQIKEDLLKFKKMWKENREEIMEKLRKDAKNYSKSSDSSKSK